MATNYIKEGNVLSVTAPHAVVSGQMVQIAGLFGVALADAANGASVEIQTSGVFTLNKTSTLAIAAGDRVFSASGASQVVDKTVTARWPVGVAIAAAANPTAAVQVKLGATPASGA